MKKTLPASVSHTEETIKELRADRQFAVAYLKAAQEELDTPNNRAAGLLALRDVAEQAGISREACHAQSARLCNTEFSTP